MLDSLKTFALHDKGTHLHQAFGGVGSGIYEDGLETRKISRRAIQQEQAGLGGDREANFVGDLKPPAPDKTLLAQEYLDQPV